MNDNSNDRSQNSVGSVPEHVLFQELLEKEIVLLDLRSGEYYNLNEMGSIMWTLLINSESIDQIVNSLLEEFDADRDTLHKDLVAFAKNVSELGLMELCSEATSEIA